MLKEQLAKVVSEYLKQYETYTSAKDILLRDLNELMPDGKPFLFKETDK